MASVTESATLPPARQSNPWFTWRCRCYRARSSSTNLAVDANAPSHELPVLQSTTQLASGETHTVLPLQGGLSYVQSAAGLYHTVMLRSDRRVVAWGDNNVGQCDFPAVEDDFSYTQVAARTC